jgi:subtilisin family serine protease
MRGPRAAALVLAWLVSFGVFAAGPAAGAADQSELVRVTVMLDDAPLAKYRDTLPNLKGVLAARTAKGHIDAEAPASRAYLAHLAGKHKEFEERLQGKSPNAKVHWRYDTSFNGLTIEVPRDQIDAVRRLPHVVSVTETYELEPELDESRALLGLQTLWQSLPTSPLGAGAGLRLALIDSGANALHPFFDDDGFTAPAGYPKAQRVAGGVRTNLPLATYASNKMIVGNVYAYPGDTTATPWGPLSAHGTHVAGIMAGNDGTYTYTTGGASFPLRFSGMAPGAYLMSYRLDGDSAEFLAAIEDVVADRADALNISLGHSRWLSTDPEHDPLRSALDGAVDAGVIVAVSSGNAGANGDSSVTGSFKLSPKILTVANSSHARVFSNPVSVTSAGAPANLRARVSVAAPLGPVNTTVTGSYVVAPGGGADGRAGELCAVPTPATAFQGKIILASRGTCTFEVKKNNAVAAGAMALVVHNNAGDPPFAMGFTTPSPIPAVMVSMNDGKAMVAWAASNPTATDLSIEAPVQRLTSGWPDIVAGGSSKGPTPALGIKPDIAAPGTSILSSVVNDTTGAVDPAAPFEQFSGTSMSTPHVTALAALTRARHPSWTPAQVKSALMNTAETEMSLDADGAVPALAKHRGAGRVDAARLVDPHLTFDKPSVSFGLMRPTESKSITITAADMRSAGGATGYSLTVDQLVGHAAVAVTPSPTFTTTAGDSSTFTVQLATAGAPAGDYEGFLVITGGNQTFTIPYFVRVLDPAAVKDVLLIDWDASPAQGFADFRSVYTAALDGLGLTWDVFNGIGSTSSPSFVQLQQYRAVVVYTGNNTFSWAANHPTGGSFPLQDYLLAGGKLIVTGQDFNSQISTNQNTGSDWLFATMAGWQTGTQFAPPPACTVGQSDKDFYGSGTTAPPAAAQLETAFTLFGRTGDVSVNMGGNGANNQRFPDAGRTLTDADWLRCVEAYNATSVEPHARVLGRYTATRIAGAAAPRLTDGVATGVAGDPTLTQLDPLVPWNAALLHVGLEGLNDNRGQLSAQTALGLLHDFVSDSVSVSVAHKVTADRVAFVATAASARGAAITKYRWDFGDGSPIVETTTPTVTHEYGKGSRGTYTAYVEATNALTRTGVGSASVRIIRR